MSTFEAWYTVLLSFCVANSALCLNNIGCLYVSCLVLLNNNIFIDGVCLVGISGPFAHNSLWKSSCCYNYLRFNVLLRLWFLVSLFKASTSWLFVRHHWWTQFAIPTTVYVCILNLNPSSILAPLPYFYSLITRVVCDLKTNTKRKKVGKKTYKVLRLNHRRDSKLRSRNHQIVSAIHSLTLLN